MDENFLLWRTLIKLGFKIQDCYMFRHGLYRHKIVDAKTGFNPVRTLKSKVVLLYIVPIQIRKLRYVYKKCKNLCCILEQVVSFISL